MSYSISKYNGTLITTVQDGTIDTSLDIKLIGKSYAGYGQAQNENFVYLLENFSNNTPPPNPMTGQIWFDSGTNKLKFYDGSKFRTTGGAEVGTTAPTGLTVGDFWFDTVNKQLFSWNGTSFTLIGPQGVSGAGTTQMQSVSVRADDNTTHAIIKAIVNGSVVYVVSTTAFNLDSTANAIDGFQQIQQGVTLRNTTSQTQIGVTTSSDRFWGTASNSDKLGGYSAEQYVKSGTASFEALVNFSDFGYTMGSQNIPKLKVYNDGSVTPTFESTVGGVPIKFKTTTSSSQSVYPLQLLNTDVLPGVTNVSNLGSSTLKWANIYSNYVYSTAQQSDALNVLGSYVQASIVNETGVSSIVARDSTGTINVTYMNGTAQQSDKLGYNGTYVAGSSSSTASTVVVRDASANIAVNVASVTGITKTGTTGSGDVGQSNNRFGTIYASTFNGAVAGNVTGNVTGALTGNVYSSDSTLLLDTSNKVFNGTLNSSTGYIYAGNGSATNPSITFNSDNGKDTGFYWISDGIIGIANNGTYSGRIDASHNLTMVGDVYATVFHGIATSANYADLAEKYLADREYAVGTVLKVGGSAEVTAATSGTDPIGVVSANPAYLMNKDLKGEFVATIALKGRVPVLVKGSVSKGDPMIACGSGYAKSDVEGAGSRVFAYSLEDNNDDGIRLVECVII